MEIRDWDFQPAQGKGHTRMCRFIFVLLQSQQAAARWSVLSPSHTTCTFFLSQTFPLYSTTFLTALSHRQHCSVSPANADSRWNVAAVDWRKQNRRKRRINEGKNKQRIENLLGIQVKIARQAQATGSPQRIRHGIGAIRGYTYTRKTYRIIPTVAAAPEYVCNMFLILFLNTNISLYFY